MTGNAQNQTKEQAERGTQYPADNLSEAIIMLERIKAALGFGPAQREMIAQALGYKALSGHASRRLGTLSHFDLIERAGKGAARISALGRSILMPTSETERREAIVEAAKRPNLYSSLIAKYAENALPSLLPNLLVREHGIHPSVAEAAAVTFRETLEFAGLLRNGVVFSDLEDPASDTDPSKDRSRDHNDTGSKQPSPAGRGQRLDFAAAPALPGFTIPLDNAGRIATIQIPLPIVKRDLNKIAAWLNYMNSIVDEVSDEKSPPPA